MKTFIKHKLKIILSLLIISGLLLGTRLLFFLQDGTNKQVGNILIEIIAYISICIILLILIPVKESPKQFLLKYRDIIFFSFFLFYSEIVFILDNDLRYSFVTFFSLVLIVSIIDIILLIIPKNWKYGIMIVFTIFITIYLIAQDIYLDIFSDFFSYKEIVSLKAGLEFTGGVIHFRLIHFLLIILAVLTLAFIIIFKVDNKLPLNKKSAKIFYVPLVFFVLVNINTQYPANYARLYSSDHYLYYSRYNNFKFVSRFGAINYSVRDFFTSIIPKKGHNKDIKEIDKFFENNKKVHEVNQYTGIFEGKNLIFINAESFSSIGFNEELTPNIWRLRKEGLYFSNNYVPVYPRTTSDSEFIYNTSLIPSVTDGPTCYMFYDNKFSNSMANLFKDDGYKVDAFHNNREDFYLRYKVFPNMGYENFYDYKKININSSDRKFDSIFMEQAIDYIIKEDESFMSFITTLSGHSPYNESNRVAKKHYDKVNEYNKDLPEEIKYYIATQIEVDLSIGKLFNALEEKDILDETVIVFIGDHYPYTIKTETFENYTETYDEYLKSKMPLFIWAQGIEAKKIEKLMSSFDILPTILNLFNLEADYTHYFGNDIFSNNYNLIVFYKDYSWYDGDVYVIDGEISNDSNARESYINETTDIVFEYFDIGHKILRTDYFNK